jgi:DnaJ-class molecular chaperone
MESNYGTYYDALEIPESVSQEEVSAAFRQLAMEYHPDRLAGMPHHLKRVRRDAEQKWHETQEAWSVLGDPAKRRRYDEALRAHRDQSRAASEP